MIEYYVSAKKAKAHIYDVKMVVANVKKGQIISIPNWTPGSYFIRDFARHIVSIQSNVPLIKKNSNQWEVKSDTNELVIEYEVYAYDLSVRGAYLDSDSGFINGSSLFLNVKQRDSEPHRVHFQDAFLANKKAHIATTLRKIDASDKKWMSFESDSYGEVIDHPVQIGVFERYDFVAGGIPHSLVIVGQHDGDVEKLLDDVKKICEYQISFFGKPAPFKEYLFLLTVRKDAYGGLEHRSSTALQIQRECMPVKGWVDKPGGYVNLLALFSHEYFHSWNIKKIRPACFLSYDLDQQTYTDQLWFFEGVTSYYDDLALVRSKVITVEQYLDILAMNFTKLLRNPGRKKQSLVESSFDAWIKFYQPNENSPNALVSYYLKGSIAALLIDLTLRKQTKNQISLDTIMRELWKKHGTELEGVPEKAIEELIIQKGGADMATLVHQALYTTDELSFEDILSEFGIQTTLRQPVGSDDVGGKRENGRNGFEAGSIHAIWARFNNRVVITNVFNGGAAEMAGMCPQDELIAIDNLRVEPDSFEKMLKRYPVGQKLNVTIFRQDCLKNIELTLEKPYKDTVQLTVKPTLSPSEKNDLNKWLLDESNPVS